MYVDAFALRILELFISGSGKFPCPIAHERCNTRYNCVRTREGNILCLQNYKKKWIFKLIGGIRKISRIFELSFS